MVPVMYVWFAVISFLIHKEYYCAAVTYEDLVAMNVTCGTKDNCKITKNNRMLDRVDWKERNCFCDDLCATYGDCCVDAKLHGSQQQIDFECVRLRQFGGVYMSSSCPPEWHDSETRSRCLSNDPEDPMVRLPVTDPQTGITYKNAFCASCQGIRNGPIIWHPRLECPKELAAVYKQSEILNLLRYDRSRRGWGVDLDGGSMHMFQQCRIDPVFPPSIEMHIRSCLKSVDDCPANDSLRDACSSYTAYVYHNSKPYRNPHCAICHDVPVEELLCRQLTALRSSFSDDFDPSSFSLLLDVTDLSGSPLVGQIEPCFPGQLYDPFRKACRQVFCTGKVTALVDGRCIDLESPSGRHDLLNCPKFRYHPKEFIILPDGTAYVPGRHQHFNKTSFLLEDAMHPNATSMLVCADGVQHADKFDKLMGYISAAGILVSAVCLVLHLGSVALLPEQRNTSGRCLAALSLSLLLAYVMFLSSQFRSIQNSRQICATVGALMYFFFLSSFFWMNAMAFDVWRTLKIASSELRVANDQSCRKFVLFSIYSWGLAAVFLSLTEFLEYGMGSVPLYLRPAFGVYSCWFGHRHALLLYFAAPLVAIMFANLSFFLLSWRILTQASNNNCKMQEVQSQGTLYARLAILMGLGWICGIVATYLDPQLVRNSFLYHGFWYTFILMNTLQGAFIFVFFTCTKRTWKALVKRLHPVRTDGKIKKVPLWKQHGDKEDEAFMHTRL